MYVIKLDNTTGDLYREITDEGFYATPDIRQATIFDTEKQAQIILDSYAVQMLYQTATIQKIK